MLVRARYNITSQICTILPAIKCTNLLHTRRSYMCCKLLLQLQLKRREKRQMELHPSKIHHKHYNCPKVSSAREYYYVLSGIQVQGYRQSYSNGSRTDACVHEMTLLILAILYIACAPTLHSLLCNSSWRKRRHATM